LITSSLFEAKRNKDFTAIFEERKQKKGYQVTDLNYK